jgi:hypothetical protein
MSVQKNDMVGIFGERTFFDKNNPGKYRHEEGDTSYLTNLGVEDSQIKLLTTQIDEVFSDNKVTDDERKVVAGLYAVSVVPLIVKDRADRNYPSGREDIKKDLIKFQFGNAFADQMLNSYEAKFPDNAYKSTQIKNQKTDVGASEEFTELKPPVDQKARVDEKSIAIIERDITIGKDIITSTLNLKRNAVTFNDFNKLMAQKRIQQFLPQNHRQISRGFKLGYANPKEYLDLIAKANEGKGPNEVVTLPPAKNPPDSPEKISSGMFDYILQVTKDL